MKKKLFCILLSLCLLICYMPQTMVASAATKGWTQENGEWVWLDSNGDKVTETFKLSGSTYYWLNEEGFLGSDELVEYKDNYYYVDETGAMVKSQWIEVKNNDNANGFGDTIKYYFQSSGKAYKSGKKAIDGKSYIFDNQGRMLHGWIGKSDDGVWSMGSKAANSEAWKSCDYYAGAESDGAVVTSAWKTIKVYNGTTTCDYQFYFSSNSKKYKLSDSDAEKGNEYAEKTIDDKTYKFAADGHLVDGQTEDTSGESSGESGGETTDKPTYEIGWHWVETVVTDETDEASGKMYYYRDTDGTIYSDQIATINGKKYLFDSDGSILVGLYYLEFTDDESTINNKVCLNEKGPLDSYTTLGGENYNASDSTSKSGVYFFSGNAGTDGTMATGSKTVEVDGDSYSFKFATSGDSKGKGLNGRDGSYYYVNGRKVKADSDNKFELFKRTTTSGNVTELSGGGYTAAEIVDGKTSYEAPTQKIPYALISSSGTIIKSGTKKDGDDYKIKVEDYRVTQIINSEGNTVWESEISSDAKAGTGDGTIVGKYGDETSTFVCGTDASKINPSTLFASGKSSSSESTTYMFGYDINTPVDWPTTTTALNVGTYYAWEITDNSTDGDPGDESTTIATSFNITGKDVNPSKITAKDFVTTYTGEDQEIKVTVDTSKTDIKNPRITYSLTEDGVYSDSLIFTDVTNGAQTVYYKVTSDNYNDYIGTATVTVNPSGSSSTPATHSGSSSSSSSKTQTVTDEQKQSEIEKAEAEKKAAEIAEVKTTTSGLDSMKARSSKTAKGNVKVVAKLSDAEKSQVAEFTDLSYTVKYRFYRSTKKSSDYKSMLEKSSTTYINTSGTAGTRYYYKVQLRVYDKDGNLIAKTALKDCKYATRIF